MCLMPFSPSSQEVARPVQCQDRTQRRQYATQLLERLRSPECSPDERLSSLQHLSQFADALEEAEFEMLVAQIKDDPDHRMRGMLCYALGLSGKAGYEYLITPFLSDGHHWVRANANNALWRLHLSTHNALGVLPEAALAPWAMLGNQLSHLTDELAQLRELLQQVLTRLAPATPSSGRELMAEMQRNHRAYQQIEARLVEEHRGEFAVFADGELVAVGPDQVQAVQQAMRQKPGVRLYVHRVGDVPDSAS